MLKKQNILFFYFLLFLSANVFGSKDETVQLETVCPKIQKEKVSNSGPFYFNRAFNNEEHSFRTVLILDLPLQG